MTLDQFWYEDEELFFIFIKAYQKRISYTAWMNGLYTLRAVESAINNLMPFAIGIALNGTGGKKREIINYFDKPFDLLTSNYSTNEPKSLINEETYKEWMLDVNNMF